MKKYDILGWLLLITMISVSVIFYFKLDSISNDIKDSTVPKLTITDNVQFDNLCKQFTEQWGGKEYAVYILQPNSKFKTHKELASSSISKLPILLDIEDLKNVKEKDGYFYGNSESFNLNVKTKIDDNLDYVIIPIYKHNIIVAEFYIVYDKLPENLDSRVVEAQTLTQVIR